MKETEISEKKYKIKGLIFLETSVYFIIMSTLWNYVIQVLPTSNIPILAFCFKA
jgi:hypothetical protein